MFKQNINKSLGLRYPVKAKVPQEFLNIDAIYEYKAIRPSASYKAQSWIFLTEPVATLLKGQAVVITGFDPATMTTVDEHGKHEQQQFQAVQVGKRTLYVLLDGKTDLIPAGKSGQYKLSATVNAYEPKMAVILSQPVSNVPLNYKVFGYKQNMKTDTGTGIEYAQPYIVTQVDYQNVYFPATDFVVMD